MLPFRPVGLLSARSLLYGWHAYVGGEDTHLRCRRDPYCEPIAASAAQHKAAFGGARLVIVSASGDPLRDDG